MSSDGTVGQFRLGLTVRSPLVAALGPAEATAHGMAGVFQPQPFNALGYQCSPGDPNQSGSMPFAVRPVPGQETSRSSPDTPLPGPFCQTIYYLNSAGILEGFFTASPSFATAKGTRVGMTTAEAQAREGAAATTACYAGIMVTTPGSARVLVGIPSGATPVPSSAPVRGLEADAGLGLLEC